MTTTKYWLEEFNTFSIDKIAKIRENLQHTREECNLVQSTTHISEICNLQSDQVMKNFILVDHKYFSKFIMKSPPKNCELDTIPTEILRDIVVEISLLLTAQVSCSLENGVCPDKLKEAFLRPLLKKVNLDPIKKN